MTFFTISASMIVVFVRKFYIDLLELGWEWTCSLYYKFIENGADEEDGLKNV
jgi:hypothetical protein